MRFGAQAHFEEWFHKEDTLSSGWVRFCPRTEYSYVRYNLPNGSIGALGCMALKIIGYIEWDMTTAVFI